MAARLLRVVATWARAAPPRALLDASAAVRVARPAVPAVAARFPPAARRGLFIQVQATPNPRSMKFLPGKAVLADGATADFTSYRDAQRSPLARKLFAVEGVQGVFLGPDFVSVTLQDEARWPLAKPDVFGHITDFYASGEPALLPNAAAADDGANTTIREGDSEVVANIKELLETRIRPAVQEDGGDIIFKSFENGIVRLQLQGSCKGCPSSSSTLKSGIENMLMHYIEEVQGVEEWIDTELQRVNEEAVSKLEARTAAAGGCGHDHHHDHSHHHHH